MKNLLEEIKGVIKEHEGEEVYFALFESRNTGLSLEIRQLKPFGEESKTYFSTHNHGLWKIKELIELME